VLRPRAPPRAPRPRPPRSIGNQIEDRAILAGTQAALNAVPVVGPVLAQFAPVVAPLVEDAVDAVGNFFAGPGTSFDYEAALQKTATYVDPNARTSGGESYRPVGRVED